MTDDPRSHQYSDADWEHQIDSKQRAGTTGQTLARRHGEVSEPSPSDGNEPNDHHDEDNGGFDGDGIPKGI